MTYCPGPRALVVGLLTACLLLVGLAAPPARAGSGDPQLQALLDTLVANGATGALAVVDDGQQTLRVTSGVARLDPQQRLRADARFRAGSVTKTFVATLALKLVADGTLRLDDTVDRWLPGLVPNGKAITLRMLLNHTSGLYNYTADPVFVRNTTLNRTKTMTPQQLIAIGLAHPPTFAPGTRYAYSNTGYILAGLIIEAATKRPVEQVMQDRIVGPLQLAGTSFPTELGIDGYNAHGYLPASQVPDGPVDVTRFSPSLVWTAGGMISTADGLRRFYGALLGGQLLPANLMAEMTTTVRAGLGLGYGLGLFAQRSPCGTGWGHVGNVPGYVTVAVSDRSGQRSAVVMMSTQPDQVLAPLLATVAATAGCRAMGRVLPARALRAASVPATVHLPSAGALLADAPTP